MTDPRTRKLIDLDHAHVWHPFTPMRQWRESDPLVIERGEAEFLFDTEGRRYIDGVSSLWCNVHGHRVKPIDDAIRDQLTRVAHSTLLGLANVPATELAARLVEIVPGGRLTKVFYSDSGATATEVAFKMAVGYWHHRGQPQRHVLVSLEGAYHGDTTGAMSVGYSDLFHRPFRSMIFRTVFAPSPDVRETPPGGRGYIAEPSGLGPPPPPLSAGPRRWPLECPDLCNKSREKALESLDRVLIELGDRAAAVVVEPLVQGAAGMIVQPPGYLRGVADLAKRHGTLLIADEVATGFGRTGRMFACEHEGVAPDLLCLGKGITGGYLPLAATLATDEIAAAFEGELHEHRTLYHGHTYTGNPLACAAALASLDLFEGGRLLENVKRKTKLIAELLDPLRDPRTFPHVLDVRQCGLMIGIELIIPGSSGGDSTGDSSGGGGGAVNGDFGETTSPTLTRRPAYEVAMACRGDGVLIRPLGNTLVLMPPLCITDESLRQLTATTICCIEQVSRTWELF